MNEQFFELPEEKQLRIINAGFEVFGAYEYKRASTDLIASKAGISKGLLFYYFHNKKSLYLFLLTHAQEMIKESVIDAHFAEIRDFFELCTYAAEKKGRLLEKSPHVSDFVLRAFYSKGEDVSGPVNNIIGETTGEIFGSYFAALDYTKFKPDIDPQEILHMLTWMMDGYIHEQQRMGVKIAISDTMAKFRQWATMFKKLSYREEYQS